jgi:hypothetical protein
MLTLQVLLSAALDILVFADQMSDLNAYQYGMGRFAAVQVSLPMNACAQDDHRRCPLPAVAPLVLA